MTDVPVYVSTASIIVTATVAGQTDFDFDFLLYEAADLKAELRRADASVVSLVYQDDFSVAGLGVATGGTLTLSAIDDVEVGEELVIWRDVAIKRLADYQQGGDFLAATVNQELDSAFMIMQDLKRETDRAVKSDFGQTGPDIAAIAAGHMIVIDADGNLAEGPTQAAILASETDAAASAGVALAQAEIATTKATEAAASAALAAASAASLEPYTTVTPTAAGLALLDDVNADAQLNTLGGGDAGINVFKAANAETARNRLAIFDTVADLIADATLAYLAATVTVATGDIVEAGGFRYEVAASAAVDHHLATAGGVKLYVSKDAGGYNVLAFGAPANGVDSDDDAITAWVAAMNAEGGNHGVFPPKTYVITGGWGFEKSGTFVDARGAIFLHSGDGTAFAGNKNAVPGETAIIYAVYWEGGEFRQVDGNPTGTVEATAAPATLIPGEKLTESVSGETCWFVAQAGTTITIADHSGALTPGRTLTGELSGVVFTIATFTPGNAAVALDWRGITRGVISKVYAQGYGRSGFINVCRESVHIVDCNGYDNARHVYIPDWDTVAGNPQVISIVRPGFATHYIAGIHIEGISNAVKIRDGYTIGKNAIVLKSRHNGTNGQEVDIVGTSFEQGSGTYPYIAVRDGGAGTLQRMSVKECGFGVAAGGGAVVVADLDRVAGFDFSGNYIPTCQTGWLNFDANCTNIHIGQNQITTYAAITYACARSQISMWPYTRVVPQNEGRIDNMATYTTAGVAVEATIDVSALAFATSTDNLILMLPPSSAYVYAMASDDKSATLGHESYLQFVKDNTIAAASGYHNVQARPRYHPDNARVSAGGWVETDANGDIRRQVRSTNGGTLTAYARIEALRWGDPT